MASYPNSIYTPRERENRSGVVYDPAKKSVWFKEDADAIENEIIAIETEIIDIIDHNLKSIRDGHLYNFQSWKRLLATQPYKALEILKKVWTGETGEDMCLSLTFDGTYIYAGLNISPAKVIKIDPSTMTTVSSWTGESGEDYCFSLTFDVTYIYAGLYTSPAKVIKIDPSTMTTVSVWTGETGEDGCLVSTFDGTYIYVSLGASPAKVIKIDPSTMTTVSVWTGETDESWGNALTFDGTYIYAGLVTYPAKVIRKIMRDIDETGV